ncbi:hypothetical protein [Kamptonema sp. UHCC 0994]|uniref:CdiA C-terminal domain-containing protein n=1 Tax=Kamptonema sp. UHCC 0994 TaxID=3031329 RepID=UPI0023BAC6E6|nr:hypothetical protein [Kamptonema sp. UHCC 0994]MDF0557021.1 hypothetical protein [Kamptonema sp. UHCC 0994]
MVSRRKKEEGRRKNVYTVSLEAIPISCLIRWSYYNAESEYQRYYFDEGAGGFVLVHSEHNLNDSERFVAEILAKMGKRVILLSERAAEGVKTPDANIDGEVWEFKELTEESKSLKNRVQEGISKSRKQGWQLEKMLGGRKQWEQAIEYAIFGDVQESVSTGSPV